MIIVPKLQSSWILKLERLEQHKPRLMLMQIQHQTKFENYPLFERLLQWIVDNLMLVYDRYICHR